MAITIRTATPADAEACGEIAYRAFQTLADRHNFSRPYPSAEVATGLLSRVLANPGFCGVVAELDGRIVGSNFADGRSSIAGIGPITVDPEAQGRGIGRTLMQAALDHLTARKFAGIRLVQAAFNNQSLCLYAAMGFQVREPLSVTQGPALNMSFPGRDVRPATAVDIAACKILCRQAHGFDRALELREAVAAQAARVEHLGRITAYKGGRGAETNQDLKALIGDRMRTRRRAHGCASAAENPARQQPCSARLVVETDRHQSHLHDQSQLVVETVDPGVRSG
jgi:predicted N-acetyltransferase YhbS